MFPACSPHLPGASSRPLAPGDLNRYVLLHDQRRGAWSDWFERQRIDPRRFDLERGPVFSQTSLAIDAAVAGQGVALARSALAELDLCAGRLVRPVVEEAAAAFAYWVVCPRRHADRSNGVRFRQWLLRQTSGNDRAGAASA